MNKSLYDLVVKAKGVHRPPVSFPSSADLDRLNDAAIMAWSDDIEKDMQIQVKVSFLLDKKRRRVGVRVSAQQMSGDRNRIEMTGTVGKLVVENMILALDAESSVRHQITVYDATSLRQWITEQQKANAQAGHSAQG